MFSVPIQLNFLDRVLLLAILIILLSPIQIQAIGDSLSQSPAKISKATDVLTLWKQHQRLYVKGNLGISQQQLDSLEVWLDEKAPNWLVVLLENAEGEVYTDAQGQTYYGIEAVNQGLGKGLQNRTEFGAQTDPRNNERNCAFFVLFLKERKLTYYASDEQDTRGLGEKSWIGNLDHWAIAAMRSGGRVIDAAKDTITNINGLLDRKISEEATARAQTIERAKDDIATAKETVLFLEETVLDLRKVNPTLSGDLIRPNLALMRADIRIAESALAKGEPDQALRASQRANESISAHIQEIEAYKSVPGKFETIAQKISEQEKRVHAKAAKMNLEAAIGALRNAGQEHTRGDSSYKKYLEAASNSLSSAQKIIDATVEQYRKAEAEIAVLNLEIKTEQVRKRASTGDDHLIKAREALGRARTVMAQPDSFYSEKDGTLEQYRKEIMSARAEISTAKKAIDRADLIAVLRNSFLILILAGMGSFGVIRNRRRLGVKIESEQLLKDWETALREKMEALFNLLDRAKVLLGSSNEQITDRYRGETLELARQIIKDLDESFIMLSSASRVLDGARMLIQPQTLTAKAYNLFSVKKYKTGLSTLRSQSVTFRPEEGLESIISGNRTERSRLLGRLEDYQPFAISFNMLIKNFNSRAERALSSLDAIDSSWKQAGPALDSVQEILEAANTRGQELTSQATDGLFLAPTLSSHLIPAASTAIAEVRTVSLSDPVGAMGSLISDARQKAEDALALTKLIAESRIVALKKIHNGIQILSANGLSIEWVRKELSRLSDCLESLACQAVSGSASEGIEKLKIEITELDTRVEQAVALDQLRREKAKEALDGACSAIEEARVEIAQSLGIESESVLREQGADPSDRTREAADLIEEAKVLLEAGQTEIAENRLKRVIDLSQGAISIVNATKKAHEEYEKISAERRQETGRITGAVTEYESILRDIGERYAPTVLKLGAGDPAHPNANGTVHDNIVETRNHLTSCRELQQNAKNAYLNARLLESSDFLRRIKGHQDTAIFRLQEIKEKQSRLVETEASNSRFLITLEAKVKELEATVSNPKIMKGTVRAFENGCKLVVAAKEMVEVKKGDPFIAADNLLTAGNTLDQIDQQTRNDIEIYSQTEQSLKTAKLQLEAALQWAQRATSDNVSDSPAIVAACRELNSLSSSLSAANQEFNKSHGNWSALNAEASRIFSEAGRQAAILRAELQNAEKAMAAISVASLAVHNCGAWTGSYGVQIMGQPGSNPLSMARSLIMSGDYEAALRSAAEAQRDADFAMARAQAEVQRLYLLEQERIAEERRRREQEEQERQRSLSSSESSWSSSSSFGSSDSGSSTSSWSSSDSGTSTSGW
jgi:hypothetical protein